MMVPLGVEATAAGLRWGDGWHRPVALRHAALHGRPGLWGDDPARPASLLWLRDGGDQWDAFGAGRASPALDWLERRATGRPIVLAAPAAWEPMVRLQPGSIRPVVACSVETWCRPAPGPTPLPPQPGGTVRPLGPADAVAFAALSPRWALGAWGDWASALAGGAACGVSGRRGLAAAAWVVESDQHFDKVGVITAPQYRRLGLGRAVAGALVEVIERRRRRRPLWVVHPANGPSQALGRALGFTRATTETLLRWEP